MFKKKLSLISILMILILSVNGCGMIPSSTEIETYLKENDIEGKLDRLIDAETEMSSEVSSADEIIGSDYFSIDATNTYENDYFKYSDILFDVYDSEFNNRIVHLTLKNKTDTSQKIRSYLIFYDGSKNIIGFSDFGACNDWELSSNEERFLGFSCDVDSIIKPNAFMKNGYSLGDIVYYRVSDSSIEDLSKITKYEEQWAELKNNSVLDEQDIEVGQVFEGNEELNLPIKAGYWDVVSNEDYYIFILDGTTSENINDSRRQHKIVYTGNEVREFRVEHGNITVTYLGNDSPISNVKCISRPDNKYDIDYAYFDLDFEKSFGIILPDEYTEEEYNEWVGKTQEVEKFEDHVEVVQFNYKVQEDKPYVYAELPGCTTDDKGNVCISEDYIVKLNPKEENLYEVKYRPAYYDWGQSIHIYSSEFDIDHLMDDKLYMLHQWNVDEYEEILDQKEYDTRIVPLIEKYVKTNKE